MEHPYEATMPLMDRNERGVSAGLSPLLLAQALHSEEERCLAELQKTNEAYKVRPRGSTGAHHESSDS